MEQRDYLMRQIEQLGQVLARALARLLNMKHSVPGGLSLEEIKQVYSDEMDLTLDLLLEIPEEGLIDLLTARINFISHHLGKMAEILAETAGLYGDIGDYETARNLLGKSIRIYGYLQETSGTYSLDRVMKISELNRKLQALR